MGRYARTEFEVGYRLDVRGPDDAAFRHERGNEMPRRNVECRIVDGCAFRRDAGAGKGADLFGAAFFDGDFVAARDREVECRAGRSNVEGNPMMRREDRERVGADLVRGVAVARDAVGAGDYQVDPLAFHRDGRCGVGHQHSVHTGLAQLEIVQPRSLQERPSLTCEDVRVLRAPLRGDDDAERRAAAGGRERPRVADRHDSCILWNQLEAVFRNRFIDGDLFLVDRLRFFERVVCAENAVDRPCEIDGSGTRVAYAPGCLEKAGLIGDRPAKQRHAVRREDADAGCNPDGESLDRAFDLGDRASAFVAYFVRQPALIEIAHAIAIPCDGDEFVHASSESRRAASRPSALAARPPPSPPNSPYHRRWGWRALPLATAYRS